MRAEAQSAVKRPSEFDDVGKVAALTWTICLSLSVAFIAGGLAITQPDDPVRELLIFLGTVTAFAFAAVVATEVLRQMGALDDGKPEPYGWRMLMGVNGAALLVALFCLIAATGYISGHDRYYTSGHYKLHREYIACMRDRRSQLDRLLNERSAAADAAIDCAREYNVRKSAGAKDLKQPLELYCAKQKVAWDRTIEAFDEVNKESCQSPN